MNKNLLSLLLILFFFNVNAQIVNPKIIELPEKVSENDFSFLKEELKNVQVVMLGEKTHFDGNVFEVKTEIIKYLHQELGFNTIAFESGIYDVWKAQNSINNGGATNVALNKSLFSIWSKKKSFAVLLTFLTQIKLH